VLGILIDVGVDRHGSDAESGRSHCDAASDLSSISDQEFAEHGEDLEWSYVPAG
jgi:hypothetical protein